MIINEAFYVSIIEIKKLCQDKTFIELLKNFFIKYWITGATHKQNKKGKQNIKVRSTNTYTVLYV